MADPAEVGKYGTIRLLRRREPSGVVTAYPIDDEEVSFGRDASCSVRLYYPEVSQLHCKIIFEERKAFLQVFGASGVIVDGCPVYPVKSAIPGDPSTTVTVPLPNGSVFEIHKKRFAFNYPPKALRPQLFTPATTRHKSIRMSLVQSAQVFSPAPSPYPRENLRVLQSPLKLPSSESPVRLVDGDHPRVYEEEQDLIILEDVEPQMNGIPFSPVRLQTLPPVRQGPPQTPRRRSQPSLHRAVLIRSAQRTAYTQAQMQRQQPELGAEFEEIDLDDEDAEGEYEDDEDSDNEEEEEHEVINSILNISGESEEDATSYQGTTEEMAIDVFDGTNHVQEALQLERVVTLVKQEPADEDTNEERLVTPFQVNRAPHLGAFMTPQPGIFVKFRNDNQNDRRKTGPQRPPPGFIFSITPGGGANHTVIKEEDMDQEVGQALISPTKRREISEEERKAILQRRKSALKMPDPEIGEGIFKTGERGTSGLPPPLPPPTSPFKTLSAHIEKGEDTQVVLQRMQAQVAERRASLSPTRPRINRDIGGGTFPPSPTKTFSLLASASRIKSPIREMPSFEEGMIEEMRNQHRKQDSMDVDVDADAYNAHPEGGMEENDENTRPNRARSATPRLDGVREMFRVPSAPAGLATPAIRGVRDLFRAPQTLQTPRLEGIRGLFAENRAQETPDFEGLGDLMHVDKQDSVVQNKESDNVPCGRSASADVPEDVDDSPESAGVQRPAPARKLPLATRTLQRSKGSRPTLIRSRGTPTDASAMADDEATPDTAPVELPKKLKPKEGVPEAAVIHRGGRVRRGTKVESDAETTKATSAQETDTESTTKSPPRRGRAAKTTVERAEEANRLSPTKPPSKPRGRRKVNNVSTVTDSDVATDTASQPTRRGKRAVSAQPEVAAQAPTPSTRRATRGRSRSAEPDSDVDTNDANTRPGAHVRGTTVETIPEEEEPVSSQAQAPRKTSAPPTTRTRRTRTRTDSSAEDAPPKKRAGSAKGAVSESVAEGTSYIEDKENTPETSPVSESGDDSSAMPSKSAPKGRAGAKAAPTSKTKAALGRSKIPSKSARTEGEDSAPAPRSTRARARK